MAYSKRKQKSSNWTLDDLIKAVELSHDYDRENYKRYHDLRSFIYYDTLTSSQKSALTNLNRPTISFNSLEAFVSKLKGEYAKHVPSVSLIKSALSNTTAAQIDFAEGYIRNSFDEADKHCFRNESYDRCLTGGYNVAKVFMEYENADSFWQDIKVKNSFNPTLCGFDPMARESHKGDGTYCFEIYPMDVDSFKRKYPKVNVENLKFPANRIGNFSWVFRSEERNYIMVCDMYTKKEEEIEVVQLIDGSGMEREEYEEIVEDWNNIEPPPAIADTRMSTKTNICRHRFVQAEILEYEETDFEHFPLVYIDGNKVEIQNQNYETKEIRRPYFWQCKGMQQLKDVAGQTWAYCLENMVNSKFIISMEALPSEAAEIRKAYLNNQIPSVLLWHEISKDNPNVRLTPPQPVQQQPMPPEVMQAFSYAEQAFQFMLGSYDSSLGINDNQLSGTAIMEGATQTNAAAMPYIISQLAGLERIAEIIINMIPKVLKHSRPVEIVNKDNKKHTVGINEFGEDAIDTQFNTKKFKVKIEAGVNFSIQQAKALQQMAMLSQYIPLFGQLLSSKYGLPVVLSNIEFHGSDRLIESLPAFFDDIEKQQQAQQQMAAQASQTSPQMIKAKTGLEKLKLEAANSQKDHMLKAASIAIQNKMVDNDSARVMVESHDKKMKHILQVAKLEKEKKNSAVDNAVKLASTHHKHSIDMHNITHKTLDNTSKHRE